jgi:hypothetical protein
MSDLAQLFGYQRTFGNSVLNSLDTNYPKICLSPESIGIFNNFQEESNWKIEKRKYVSKLLLKSFNNNNNKVYFMVRKYPQNDELIGTFNILMHLLKTKENNLVEGDLEEDYDDRSFFGKYSVAPNYDITSTNQKNNFLNSSSSSMIEGNKSILALSELENMIR